MQFPFFSILIQIVSLFQKNWAGSHSDNLRIGKPDEFDMDIVISLPLNYQIDYLHPLDSDINIEHNSPGYVQLRMGTQFQKLPERDPNDWHINKIAYKWMDPNTKYLLRSKFQDWWRGLVQRALNKLEQDNCKAIIRIDNNMYKIKLSDSGPATTLNIEGTNRFKCCVDLVPALRFPESRWPICKGYEQIPNSCTKKYWMVVPKPKKVSDNYSYEANRSWRVTLPEQERALMYKTERLRQSIRFVS